MAKTKPTVNNALALETIAELLAQVCSCGHLEGEHHLTKQLKSGKCFECACRKFDKAYDLKVLPAEKAKPRG